MRHIRSHILSLAIAPFFVASLFYAEARHPFDHNGVITVKGKTMFTYTARYTSDNEQTLVVTDCYDLAGKRVAREQTTFASRPLRLIEAKMEDFRSGRYERVTLEASGYVAQFRATSAGALKERRHERSATIVTNTLLLPFILANWGRLASGEEISFDMLLAERSSAIGFRMRTIGEETINGAPCFVVKADPSSWIIRQFASPIFFALEKEPPHRLRQYRGRLASLKTPEGEDIDGVATAQPLGN